MKIKRKYAEEVSLSQLIPAPTLKIISLRNSLFYKLGQFRKDTYNEQEEELTDDELIKTIKTRKLKDQVVRADAMTDYTAVDDIANGIRATKKKIPTNSVVSKSLDIAALRKRQQEIRNLIDRADDKEDSEVTYDFPDCSGFEDRNQLTEDVTEDPQQRKMQSILQTNF